MIFFICSSRLRVALTSLILAAAAPAGLAFTGPERKPDSLIDSQKGPWGEMQYYHVVLEPPLSHIWPELLTQETRWFIPGQDRKEAEEFLKSCGIEEEVIAQLRPDSYWRQIAGGFAVLPPPEVVGAIRPDQRTALYVPMIQVPGTTPADKGFVIEGTGFRELARNTLPEHIIELVDQVKFLRGGNTCVADLPWLMQQIPDRATQIQLIQCLCRTRALVARLKVTPESDLEEIASWWSAGLKNKAVLPMIQSVSETDGVQYIDVLHLLPPSARQYVYTYIRKDDVNFGEQADCFWAAMNFFHHEATDRMLDPLPLKEYVEKDFEEVSPPAHFGDLAVMVSKDTQDFIHAWVEIADDVVYTKNGNSVLHPWLLMRRGDMLTRYADVDRVATRLFRRK